MKNTQRGELALCGLETVKAAADARPDSIQRLFFTADRAKEFGDLCSAMARRKRAYRLVEALELEKLSGTVHHQGVVAMVKARIPLAISDAVFARWAQDGSRIVVLDRVGDDHNLGSIARSAAFFGWHALVLPDDDGAARLSTAAYRVARGALERIAVYAYPGAAAFARRCGKAILALGADHRASMDLDALCSSLSLQGQAEGARRAIALFLGNEESGLSQDTRQNCSQLVSIRGAGEVESLNVSQAAAVFFHALAPEHKAAR